MEFSSTDLQQMAACGIAVEAVKEQLQRFQQGVPPIRIERPCTIDDGIRQLDTPEIHRLRQRFQTALNRGRVTKMVPASGAATRMFQALLTVLERNDLPEVNDLRQQAHINQQVRDTLTFLENLEQFPFQTKLARLAQARGTDLKTELAAGVYREVLQDLLTTRGMDCVRLPKAVLPFHSYKDYTRTAVEEHLQEAQQYACDREGRLRLHLTISDESRAAVEGLLARAAASQLPASLVLEITCSDQHTSTDTIAVDSDNYPLRDDQGRLVFRPGGHGALLENLQELGGDVIFVKNIDNVAHDRHLALTVEYKQALGGLLLELQDQLFAWLQEMTTTAISPDSLGEMLLFVQQELGLQPPGDVLEATAAVQLPWMIARLNRPLRICGVVRNEGEPGGGPFWVRDDAGMETKQLVELGQVDVSDPDQQELVNGATHFSPVDLVCGVRDFRGDPFDLHQFRDPASGMISEKSYQGRQLKALELPGLWNGGMAYWNTVFVEVPPLTFNPVKSVLDLLRPPHQPQD
ncbi:MAG: DUF4301 family protein [Candidatus Delongbacteria bacterium]|nr:DUF4301 family protein [Candidatus Delongbacteria bacterium]